MTTNVTVVDGNTTETNVVNSDSIHLSQSQCIYVNNLTIYATATNGSIADTVVVNGDITTPFQSRYINTTTTTLAIDGTTGSIDWLTAVKRKDQYSVHGLKSSGNEEVLKKRLFVQEWVIFDIIK